MKKNIWLSGIIIFIICGINTLTIFAKEPVTNSEPEYKELSEEEILYIEFDNDEDYELFFSDVQESNKRAEVLWEQALKKSEEINLEYSPEENMEFLRAYKVLTSPRSKVNANGYYGGVYFTCTADIVGSKFKTIYNVGAYEENSNTKVSISHKQHRYLDGNRTCAVNYSLVVGVKKVGGVYHYINVSRYVEFYQNGGSRVYD